MTEPVLTHQLNGMAFEWPSLSLRLSLSRIRESGGETKAELVAANQVGILTHQSINLLAGRSRIQLAKELAQRHPVSSPSWESILELVCVRGLRELRRGDPVVALQPSEQAHVPFLLNPLIFQKHQTMIYAPGGSCKSMFALYLALLASHGASQNGLASLACPVLYLDWELDEETIGVNLNRLYRGHPELSQYTPFYRHCQHPLHDDVDPIAQEVQEKGIRLVVIDSAMMACGDDMNSTVAPKLLQRALRSFGCASLVLTHVAKNTEEKTAYGNVFFQNLCRNQYELQLVDSTDTLKRITLTHRKINFGPFQPLKGFALDFAGDACQVRAFDPEAEEACQDLLPIPSRIRNLLDDGEVRSAKEIAQDLKVKLETIKAVLSKHRGTKWQMLGENRTAKWTVLNR